jgi:hydrogenase maturation protein HypF
VQLPGALDGPEPDVLAVGPHLKNTIAVAKHGEITLSQHLGDLDSEQALLGASRCIEDLTTLTDARPRVLVCDAHPDYASTLIAEGLVEAWSAGPEPARDVGASANPPSAQAANPSRSLSADGPPELRRVHHHLAHVLAVMAEHGLDPPLLGLAWDGAGLGPDGTVWGGELLRVDPATWSRVARVRPFPLPGGDRAAREPRRSALGVLYAALGDGAFTREGLLDGVFTQPERNALRTMLAQGVQAPLCSSVGRLFDAWASLLGIRQIHSFEGQAAVELEYAAHRIWVQRTKWTALPPYPVSITNGEIDWRPWLEEMLAERRILHTTGGSVHTLARLAARFHRTWIETAARLAKRADLPRIVLSGGCFQNRILLEGTIERLRHDGFQVHWPQQVPPNDGGIALGQAAAARRRLEYAGDRFLPD